MDIKAVNKLSFYIKRKILHKINDITQKEVDKNKFKNSEANNIGGFAKQEHSKNKKDNEQKKSLRKKLIIGSCVTLVIAPVIVYFNFIAGIVSLSIGVCVLVICGICKSKSNKIQSDTKNLLNIPMNTNKTKLPVNCVTKCKLENNVDEVKSSTLSELEIV